MSTRTTQVAQVTEDQNIIMVMLCLIATITAFAAFVGVIGLVMLESDQVIDLRYYGKLVTIGLIAMSSVTLACALLALHKLTKIVNLLKGRPRRTTQG